MRYEVLLQPAANDNSRKFRIEETALVIRVIKVGHRRDVYEEP